MAVEEWMSIKEEIRRLLGRTLSLEGRLAKRKKGPWADIRLDAEELLGACEALGKRVRRLEGLELLAKQRKAISLKDLPTIALKDWESMMEAGRTLLAVSIERVEKAKDDKQARMWLSIAL